MGAPPIFEKQIEIRLLHPVSTEEVTIPLCFPKIGVNLWVHLQFLKNK
ncbi:MAG: hypothetical protein P8X74_22835 [Reinekea sp.]